jgi:hypothetical protein
VSEAGAGRIDAVRAQAIMTTRGSHMTNTGSLNRSTLLKPIFGSPLREWILLYVLTRGEAYPRELAQELGFALRAVQRQLGLQPPARPDPAVQPEPALPVRARTRSPAPPRAGRPATFGASTVLHAASSPSSFGQAAFEIEPPQTEFRCELNRWNTPQSSPKPLGSLPPIHADQRRWASVGSNRVCV